MTTKVVWFVAMLFGLVFFTMSAVGLRESQRILTEAMRIREDAVSFASRPPQPPYTAAPVEGETCRCRVWECRREP